MSRTTLRMISRKVNPPKFQIELAIFPQLREDDVI
jgi:hypothetical protein